MIIDELFRKCVTIKETSTSCHITCNKGLWSVSARCMRDALPEAYHYWRQYKADGEYADLIGGDDVKTVAMRRIEANDNPPNH